MLFGACMSRISSVFALYLTHVSVGTHIQLVGELLLAYSTASRDLDLSVPGTSPGEDPGQRGLMDSHTPLA